MNILADASLPGLQAAFPKPFNVSTYSCIDEIPSLLDQQDVFLCRSTLKVNQALLAQYPLKYLATASSGTDHLDHDFLRTQNIHTIDAKGSNAVSVADYVIASLAYLDKNQFIKGNKVGIIGMGKVGTIVFSRLQEANFEICSYDPLKTNFQSCALEDLYQCDILCIHAELHNAQPYPSYNLINKQFLNQLKPECIIINAARGGIVDEEALLQNQRALTYCTDVYLNEPKIDKRIIERATLCTPHIAGHSLEAKYEAVSQVSKQLHQLLGLPVPKYATPALTQTFDLKKYNSWQELALSLYNPAEETLELKQAQNIESSFLTLRKNHQNRHDFPSYFEDATDLKIFSKAV